MSIKGVATYLTLQAIHKRSLTDKQIKDAFNKFKSITKLLRFSDTKQLTKKIESGYISYSLKKKSNTYRVSTPKISICEKQYCKNLENVRTVEIRIFDCSECRGGDSAEITSKKYASFENILTDAFTTWLKAFNRNLELDRQEIENEKNIETLKKLFKKNSKKIKENNRTCTEYFLHNRIGNIHIDSDHKSKFNINLENLSFSEMSRLHKILNSFLKEESV